MPHMDLARGEGTVELPVPILFHLCYLGLGQTFCWLEGICFMLDSGLVLPAGFRRPFQIEHLDDVSLSQKTKIRND